MLIATAGLAGGGLGPASATHTVVTAVSGSAFGYWSDNISLFGGAQPDTGPVPTVALAADASNSPQNVSVPTGLVSYGPAVLFTSDTISLSTTGTVGPAGVTTTSSIDNINKAASQPTNTGGEILTADNLSGSASATSTGRTGSTSVVGGTLATHSNSTNCSTLATPCGGHTHNVINPDGLVDIPANPAPNHKVEGHVHLNDTTTDYYVVVFNEQVVNADGSITVNPAHEYFGARLGAGGAIVADSASILKGDLYLGQVKAGVTAVPGPNAAPVAGDDTYSTACNAPLTVPTPGVLANDSDADGGTLTAGGASNPPLGSVTLNADGSFTYTPDPVVSGTDTFTYTVTDDHGATDTGTVTINVATCPTQAADLNLDVSGPTQATTLQSVAYNLIVTNEGPDPATGSTLTATLSQTARGAKISSVTTNTGTCSLSKGKERIVTCNLGTILAAANQNVAVVTVTVEMPRKPGGTVTVAGTVSATPTDPDSADNSDSATTSVV